VRVREKVRELFESAGIENPFHPGSRSEAEVNVLLAELGFGCVGEVKTGPGPAMTLRDFLGKIISGEVSYIWSVPKHAQDLCLP
jgi:hypothetical protein